MFHTAPFVHVGDYSGRTTGARLLVTVVVSVAASTVSSMTVREHMVLQVASRRYRFPGAQVAAVRDELGMSEVRYAQVLTALLDRPDAEAAYPVLVRRLRRLRDARREERAVRRSA